MVSSPPVSADTLLGLKDAARHTPISESQFRHEADLGRIPHIRDSVGRRLFKLKDVLAYAKQRKRHRSKQQRHSSSAQSGWR